MSTSAGRTDDAISETKVTPGVEAARQELLRRGPDPERTGEPLPS
jgi:hypothetical protein